MKLTLKNIRSLKKEADSPLTKYVCNYVIGKWGDYSDKIHIFTDVLYYEAVSKRNRFDTASFFFERPFCYSPNNEDLKRFSY